MEKNELIKMLNNDLKEEHAAIIRYLVHSYLEGEDSPLGASLLSRSREEMWHFHWLGLIIGELGGEPDLTPAPYPFESASRASIFESYVKYEKDLIPHYSGEAEKVGDPHIKRVLQREGWESSMHADKFQRTLDKLKPEQADGLPGEDNELPDAFMEKLQNIVQNKYTEMLQQIRNSWVLQKDGFLAWQIMDFSMTKMKQLAHIAEEVAENGVEPRLEIGKINLSHAIGAALEGALEDVRQSRQRHQDLRDSSEAQKHSGLVINLDLSIKQEKYEASEYEDWLKKV
jgi:bacterioferritin